MPHELSKIGDGILDAKSEVQTSLDRYRMRVAEGRANLRDALISQQRERKLEEMDFAAKFAKKKQQLNDQAQKSQTAASDLMNETLPSTGPVDGLDNKSLNSVSGGDLSSIPFGGGGNLQANMAQTASYGQPLQGTPQQASNIVTDPQGNSYQEVRSQQPTVGGMVPGAPLVNLALEGVKRLFGKGPGGTQNVLQSREMIETAAQAQAKRAEALAEQMKPDIANAAAVLGQVHTQQVDPTALTEEIQRLRQTYGDQGAMLVMQRASTQLREDQVIQARREMAARAAGGPTFEEKERFKEGLRLARPENKAKAHWNVLLGKVEKPGGSSNLTREDRDWMNEYTRANPMARMMMEALVPGSSAGVGGPTAPSQSSERPKATKETVGEVRKALGPNATREQIVDELRRRGY